MPRASEFWESRTGKMITVGGLVIAALSLYGSFRSSLGPSSAASLANRRIFVCEKTGKSFEVTLKPGMKIPLHSPYSGADTGYPAELCYWTAGGSVSSEPHAVLLNSLVGKPEPTFCLDCGRLVVRHNPRAADGHKAPPLKQEFLSRNKSGAGGTGPTSERQP